MIWVAGLLLVFVVMLALSLRSPAWFIGPLYGLFVFEQALQAHFAFFVANRSFVNLMMAGIVLLLLGYQKAKGELTIKTGPMLAATVGLVLLSILSMAWSIQPEMTKSFFLRDMRLFLLIIVSVPLLVRSMDDAWVAIKSVLLFSVVASIVLMQSTQVFMRQVVLVGQVTGFGQEGSVRSNPLVVATVAGYAAILTLVVPLRGLGVVWTIGRFVLFAICLVAIIRTGSRGQLAAALVVSLVAYPLAHGQAGMGKKMLATLGSVFVLGLMVFVLGQYARGGRWDLAGGIETYSGTRLGFVGQLLAYWAEAGPVAWLLGIGSAAARSPEVLGGVYTHVVAVEVLGELGLVGFTLLLIVLWRAVYNVRHLLRVCGPSPVLRCTVVGWAALLLFDFMLSFKQGTLLGSSRLFGSLLMIECMAFLVTRGRWVTADRQVALPDLTAQPAQPGLPAAVP
ncbi:MAG: hypothetical protein AAF797_12995 [Planctomycetota bacterium]